MQSENDIQEEPFDKAKLVDLVLLLRPLYILLPVIRDIRKMTYEKAIRYFIENQPPVPFAKGVMILEPDDSSPYIFFTQLFIDENNKVVSKHNGSPFGRRLLLRKLDDELSAAFGSRRIIIVE